MHLNTVRAQCCAATGARWRPRRRRTHRRFRCCPSPSRPPRPGRARRPTRRGGPLGGGDHLRALVLDRLELPDRAAELFADLGIRRGGVGGPAGDADGLGREQGGDDGPAADWDRFDSSRSLPISTPLARTWATGRSGSTERTGSISRLAASSTTHSTPLPIATGSTRIAAWAAAGTERASPRMTSSPSPCSSAVRLDSSA